MLAWEGREGGGKLIQVKFGDLSGWGRLGHRAWSAWGVWAVRPGI